MRSLRIFVVATTVLATAFISTAAWSGGGRHGHHHHHGSRASFGFVYGGPLWYPAPVYPFPYAYPYAYPFGYPPAVVVQSTPRVYIEREDRVAQERSDPGYWYYCRESNTYYPYVKECADPWERVPARP